MPRYYPMMMDVKGRECLVVGGGDVAARKVEMLVSCGAKVRVVAPEIDASLENLKQEGKVRHIDCEYEKELMENVVLAIAATDNEKVNRAVYDDACERGIPVNVVDVPPLCTFIVPSIVEQGDLLLAISTSGKSPAMAKRIRKELEKSFGPEYAQMLSLMGEVRRIFMEREKDLNVRMKILSEIANSDLIERIKAGEQISPEEVIRKTVSK